MDNQNNTEPADVTFARMKQDGHSTVVINRLKNILSESCGSNVAMFCSLNKGELMGAYNKLNPTAKKGASKTTFEAFDTFVKYQKASTYDANRAAEVAEKLRQEHEADKEKAKAEALAESLDVQVMADTLAWYSTAFEKVTLDELLASYRKFLAKKAK